MLLSLNDFLILYVFPNDGLMVCLNFESLPAKIVFEIEERYIYGKERKKERRKES